MKYQNHVEHNVFCFSRSKSEKMVNVKCYTTSGFLEINPPTLHSREVGVSEKKSPLIRLQAFIYGDTRQFKMFNIDKLLYCNHIILLYQYNATLSKHTF